MVFAHPFSWMFGAPLALVSLRGPTARLIGAASLAPSAALFFSAIGSRTVLAGSPVWHEPAFKLRYFFSSPAMVAEAANRTFFAIGIVGWLTLVIVLFVMLGEWLVRKLLNLQ